uniref:Putative transcription factor bHLH94 n=1 Tax=Davidia involucrata TaxID=16924 RepID=A0A5B7A8E1_DAVIN
MGSQFILLRNPHKYSPRIPTIGHLTTNHVNTPQKTTIQKQKEQGRDRESALMPDSYVPRGDQASIIGGAINYVKELEQRLHSLVGHNYESKKQFEVAGGSSSSSAFAEFFTFPQYSTNASHGENSTAVNDLTAQNHSAIADIEVTMVESHANLKIRSKRRPKQLLKMVSGLQCLRLTILHLNVTTVDQIVLYSLSVKVEDDCKLTSVDEIATAVNQMLGRIQEEALLI